MLALAGTKTATAGLWQQDYVDNDETIEVVGERQAILDDADHVAAIIEITRVETHRLYDVPWEFAQAEGEGFKSIEHWRDGHRDYYATHGVEINDETLFVCVWFRIVESPTQLDAAPNVTVQAPALKKEQR